MQLIKPAIQSVQTMWNNRKVRLGATAILFSVRSLYWSSSSLRIGRRCVSSRGILIPSLLP